MFAAVYFSLPAEILNLTPFCASDFLEVVAASYRPGLIRFGADDFAISVSIPIITLAESISPRTLMAWDRRLLLRSQHLTLLITGLRGAYPAIDSKGQYLNEALRRGVTLSFKVGLTQRYKPSKEWAAEASRTFGLIVEDAEDELRRKADLLLKEQLDQDAEKPDLAEEDLMTLLEQEDLVKEEEDEDDGRFDTFSLSSSLESLLNQSLLRLIQLRRGFGLGWAGAEALLSEVEKNQTKPEDVYKALQHVRHHDPSTCALCP